LQAQVIKSYYQGMQMKTIGHHTCESKGGQNHVLKESPFFSQHMPDQNKLPYLGAGYYFWDYNIDAAHAWGDTHYKGNYFIVEGDLECKEELVFDLVGNRKHIEYLLKVSETFAKHKFKRSNWELGKFIEVLKKLEKDGENKGVFPFKVIKAIDNSWNIKRCKQKSIKFVRDKKGYIFLDPKIIICFIDKENIRFYNKTVIKPRHKKKI